MLSGFLVLFRETLEAVLIIGIILGVLTKTKQGIFVKSVLAGAAGGIGLSLLAGILLWGVAGGFSEKGEELFEGTTMLIAAFLLTTVVLWMRNQRNFSENLKRQVAEKTGKGRLLGLFFLSFISILREGVEAVIFLAAARVATGRNTVAGAVLGGAAALIIGSLAFLGSLRIDMRKLFTVMGIVLLFFASGLVAQGVHELQEAKVLPVFVEHLWDINPKTMVEGRYALMHEKGAIGLILKSLFGYNGDPSLLEVAAYGVYIVGTFAVWRMKRGPGGEKMILLGGNNR